jgi:hypothetical protein
MKRERWSSQHPYLGLVRQSGYLDDFFLKLFAASRRASAHLIEGRAGPAECEDGWSTTDPSWPTRCRAPIGSGHSRDESATLSARLTVVRGRSESMTMQKQREGSTLCLLATGFASLTLTRCG